MTLQTNAGWVGDPTDWRPIKYYKGELAQQVAEELGLFRAPRKEDAAGKKPTLRRMKKKAPPPADPFEDLHR